MKTLTFFSAAIILFSSCSSMNQTASTYSDDVYASAKDKPVKKEVPVEAKAPAAAPEQKVPDAASNQERQPNSTSVETDEKGNTYITNKYYESDYDPDDYYDYEYAVRIRRFYSPVSHYGYYDNYYTNSYWYSGNPNHWGISVYYGYPWWGPSYYTYNYYPSYYYYSGWNCGWGWGYGGCGWNNGWGWGNGWCGNGWGYGYGYGYGYNHGYNDGYWDGYWNGYNNGYYNGMANNYYYNSQDNSNTFYGPHTSLSGTHSNGTGVAMNHLGANYQEAVATESGFTPVNYNTPGGQSSPRPVHSNGFNNSNDAINNSPKPIDAGEEVGGAAPNLPASGSPKPVNVIHTKPNVSESGEGNTPAGTIQSKPRPVNPGNNPNLNNLPVHADPVTPNNNNTYQSEPRPVYNSKPKSFESSNETEAPKNYNAPKNDTYEAPKHYDAPKNHEAPKNYDKPKNYETPKTYETPKHYNTPKQNSYSTPRSISTPKSSGGNSGGGHSSGGGSKPAGGGFKHR